MTATDPAFWNELGDRLRPFVARRVARAEDVDDVLQEVFVRLHRGMGDLRDDDRFGAWLFQIARSAIADQHRARGRHPFAPEESPEEPADSAADLDERLLAAMTDCVARFVADLPSPYREAITLTELQGLSQAEAAAMVGISLPGMKSRVQRGRAQLRERFERCCAITLDSRNGVVECVPKDSGRC